MIPSDDEELAGHRTAGHASSSHVGDRRRRTDAVPLPAPAAAAASTWRAFRRPRMALAVLAVSLQHIAAHSNHHPSDTSAPPTDARASSLDEGIEPDR